MSTQRFPPAAPDKSIIILYVLHCSVFQALTLSKVDELLSPGAYIVLLAVGASWVSLFVLGYLVVFAQFIYEVPQSKFMLGLLRRVGMLNASVRPRAPCALTTGLHSCPCSCN